jgi:GT2 family glycosyltransferase
VNTSVKISHHKTTYLDEATAGDMTVHPTFVVIPMKDRLDLTLPLLDQLREQGGYDKVLLFDNGSSPETKAALAELDRPDVVVFDADGLNIHQMWNRGMDEAKRRAWQSNVAILNNDLEIGPNFLAGLAGPLRSDPLLAAVCPNYDGRGGSGIQYVEDICADRYDGMGGLAGFAFMLTSESGYRFPEKLQWWYGDADLMNTILYAGSRAGIVLDVTVEHVGGGGQTGKWSDPTVRPLLDADRATHLAKWQPLSETA